MKLEFFAVVTERDTDRTVSQVGQEWDQPSGPLLHEMYVEKAGALHQAKARATQLRGKYGWAYVARVTVDTDEVLEDERR